mmetsp:Transcript_14618/g.18670  ORF Transcript_14618/g.18670 Transcript_14618/m.18670 type:complete len:455 (-) Transcript_14618:178-1542(-)
MGSSVSVQNELKRPVDASDITNLEEGVAEVKRLRKLIAENAFPKSVAICGGGNAAHVLGGLLSSNPEVTTVNILDTWEPEFVKFKEVLEANNYDFAVEFGLGMPTRHGKINKISMDPAEVIPGMDWIIVSTPAFTHEMYLKQVKDHIKDGAVVTILVAQGGSDWCLRSCLGEELCSKITYCTCENLPWSCRMSEFGKSGIILNTKASCKVAALPASSSNYACSLLNKLLAAEQNEPGPDGKPMIHPNFEPMANVLSCTLMNLNSLIHTSLSYGRFCEWTPSTIYPEPLLLYLGVEERGASAVSGVSQDLCNIRDALTAKFTDLDLSRVMSVYDFYIASYADNIGDQTDISTVLKTNKGYETLKIPMKQVEGGYIPDFGMRYYTEDIPFGLLVTRGVAEIMGVETPMMDTIITWAQEKMGKSYLKDGKVAGDDIGETRTPQKYGLKTPEDLVKWP